MRFEQMQLLCMFDLPMDTKEERRAYRIFRKKLIQNGFTMLQHSIYFRSLPNRSSLKKYEGILKRYTPKNGNIRLLYVTESQFQNSIMLVGERTVQEEIVGSKRMVVI